MTGRKWITYSGILPIEINPIKVVLIHERDQVVFELVAVDGQDGLAKDLERPGQGTEVPAAERDDLLDARHALEDLKLLLHIFVTDLDFEVASRDIGEGKWM